MGKRKQTMGKVVSMPLSPEKYIKSGRARQLPIHECLILKGWETAGIGVVLVSRKHVNGHYTGASFLVDLLCLGVKEAYSFFNLPEVEYREIRDSWGPSALQTADYNLAHSVVYGAIAFARKYGFEPGKDFNESQYVLAPAADVPLQKLTFGKDGKPFYFPGPDDDQAQIDRVIATLEKTAGPGNFGFTAAPVWDEEEDEFDDDFDEDDEDDFDEDEPWDDEDDELEDLFSDEALAEVISGKKTPTPSQAFVMTDLLYEKCFPEEMETLDSGFTDVEAIVDRMEETPDAILPANKREEQAVIKSFSLLEEGTVDASASCMEQTIGKYPHIFVSYQARCLLSDLFEAALPPEALFGKFDALFPDSPLSKLLKAYRLLIGGAPEEGFQAIGETSRIQEAFPERDGVFFEEEVSFFLTFLCRYYTATGKLSEARAFAREAISFCDPEEMTLVGALQVLVTKMGEILQTLGKDAVLRSFGENKD